MRVPEDAAGGVHEAPPRRVLVATDFTAASGRAVDQAAWIAKAGGAQLVVLHVVNPSSPGSLDGPAISLAHVIAERCSDAERRLDSIVQELRLRGVGATHLLRIGSPSFEINDAARETHADLVVVGTRGHTGLRRFLEGSVSHAAADKTQVPFLLVPGT